MDESKKYCHHCRHRDGKANKGFCEVLQQYVNRKHEICEKFIKRGK